MPTTCALLVVAIASNLLGCTHAFTVPTKAGFVDSSLAMVGGKGWENNDFLDSLGGGDEDREQAQQNYEQFKETRESFNQRQAERMKSPQAQAFLKQQQSRAQQESFFDDDDSLEDESYGDLGVSSGGSRFRNLMQKSQQMKRGMGGGGASFVDPSTGLEQKFVVPLEPDEGASDNNTDGELE